MKVGEGKGLVVTGSKLDLGVLVTHQYFVISPLVKNNMHSQIESLQ